MGTRHILYLWRSSFTAVCLTYSCVAMATIVKRFTAAVIISSIHGAIGGHR